MTIKHGVLPVSSTGNPASVEPLLCTTALAGDQKNGMIHSYNPENNLTFSVRTLEIHKDIPVIYKWMSLEYPDSLVSRNSPPEKLDESYELMLQSDFCQPYMGLANDNPLIQLDINKAYMHMIGMNYPTQKGDYTISLLMAPLVIQDHAVVLLTMWLEYFFSYPEVQRILTDVETGSEWMKTLFTRVGFTSMGKVQLPYKNAGLYGCTRASFNKKLA